MNDEERPTEDLESTQSAGPPDSLPPARIGPYRILQKIGEGGMGEVYEAEQKKPVRRKVALKLIKWGMDTKQVVGRFESERQALALMDHPGIAKVLDAGATEQGRPYFAMEFVKGEPITKYCDKHRLSTRERLELFMQVCDGVQHAHQKGIIHRDLKPTNVLVTIQDNKAVPKIIDFGVAKATEQRLTEKTVFTQMGVLVGTPEYMSPEQAEMTGLDIDTRTDVYSLGVMLYELLVGALPFVSKDLRKAGFDEIRRKIREDEPSKPSTRLNTLGEASIESAKLRRTDIPALKRQLRGDLDWITMKALDKDRTRRYPSPSELAADIGKHLKHEPVSAGSPSLTYKLTKFVKRNKARVATATVIALLLIGGVLGTLVQSARIAREAESAEAINAFFSDMLASVDPMQLRLHSGFAVNEQVATASGRAFGKDVSVADMVRRASANIGKSFGGKQELEAVARETVGMTLQSLWQFDDARDQLQAAFDIRRRILGQDHPDTLRSQLQLGYSIWDARRGSYAEAEELVRPAFDHMRRQYGREDPRTLNCGRILANVLSDQRKFDESNPLFRETLNHQRLELGPEHRDTLITMWDWSVSYIWQGKETSGERLARELYAISQRKLDPDDTIIIISALLVGIYHLHFDELDEAELLLRRALDGCVRALGEDHPFTFITMRILGQTLQGRDKQGEEERLYRDSLAGHLATFGEEHRESIFTMSNLAALLLGQGRVEEAIELRERMVEILVRTRGEQYYVTLQTMRSLAYALEQAGRQDEARHYGVRAISAGKEVARRPRATAFDLYQTAELLLMIVPADLRDPEEALRLAKRAVDLSDASIHAERHSGRTSYILEALALAYSMTGEPDKAIEIQTERLKHLLNEFLENRKGIAKEFNRSSWQILIYPSISSEAYAVALQAAERANAIQPGNGSFVNTLGIAQYRVGQYETSLATLTRSDSLNGGVEPTDAAFIAMAHHRLGHGREARAAMARLRDLMRDPARSGDALNQACAREAEALIKMALLVEDETVRGS